jgi:hypothetical protein
VKTSLTGFYTFPFSYSDSTAPFVFFALFLSFKNINLLFCSSKLLKDLKKKKNRKYFFFQKPGFFSFFLWIQKRETRLLP